MQVQKEKKTNVYIFFKWFKSNSISHLLFSLFFIWKWVYVCVFFSKQMNDDLMCARIKKGSVLFLFHTIVIVTEQRKNCLWPNKSNQKKLMYYRSGSFHTWLQKNGVKNKTSFFLNWIEIELDYDAQCLCFI